MNTSRLDFFDIAKGIAICWVVLHHIILHIGAQQVGWQINFAPYGAIKGLMTPFAMPVFFAMAGYLSRSALQKDWKIFVQRRLWPLFYLLLIWSVIRWCYYAFIQDNARNLTEGDNALQLLTFLITPFGEMWFLWALIIALVTIKLIYHLPKAIHYGVTAVMILISCLSFAEIITFDSFAYVGTCWYAVFTFIGAFIPKNTPQNIQKHALALALSTLPVFIAISFAQDHLGDVLYGFTRFVLCSIGVVMLLAICEIFTKIKILNNSLIFLGQHSLPIYVIHPLCVSAFASLMVMAHSAALPVLQLWAVPVSTAACIAIPLTVKVITQKLHMHWLFNAPLSYPKQTKAHSH